MVIVKFFNYFYKMREFFVDIILPIIITIVVFGGLMLGIYWFCSTDSAEVHGGSVFCQTTKPMMSWNSVEKCFINER